MRLLRRRIVPGGLGAVLGISAAIFLAAQEPERRTAFLRYTITGEKFEAELGYAMAAMGDVDGDGVPDMALGVPEFGTQDGVRGRVDLVSGKDGSPIRSLRSKEAWTFYGLLVANGGDFDGDGVNDVLAGNLEFVEQRSSRTGELIGTVYPGGSNVTGIGDVNCDGVPDFAVGHYRPQGSWKGRVTAYSGSNREVLWVKNGEVDEDGFGHPVVSVGDMNGDGVPDVAVGVPGTVTKPDVIGTVLVLRGQDGGEIFRLDSAVYGDHFGIAIADASDLDGDGVPDIVVGASGHAVRGQHGAGRVDAVSGRSRQLLWSQTGQDGDWWPYGGSFFGDAFGCRVVNAGDLNTDGSADFIVRYARGGFARMDWGRVGVCSGRTGELLGLYENEVDETLFGAEISALGDADRDGRPEFLIGASEFSLQEQEPPVGDWLHNIGRVYVVGFDPSSQVFIRGDADLDGDLDLSDAVAIIQHLLDVTPAPCLEALDVDRDQKVQLRDAAIILTYLFFGGMSPQPPFPTCSRFEAFRPRLPCERSSCK